MGKFLLPLLVFINFGSFGQDTLFFNSERALANYAYQNTNFSTYNIRYFKDRMFDYNDSVFNFYTTNQSTKIVHGYHTLQLAKHIENWDVQELFNADTILHPILSRFYSLTGSNDFHLPLIIADIDVFDLKNEVKSDFELNTVEDPVRALLNSDFNQNRIELVCLPLDTINYPHVWLDLDEHFIIHNTNRQVESVTLSDGVNSYMLYLGNSIDISDIFRNNATITMEVKFSDNSTVVCSQNTYYFNNPEAMPKSLDLGFTNTVEERYPFGDGPSDQHPVGKMSVSYACKDKKIRKPYLMISGWGPYTDSHLINSSQGWPTPMWKTAEQMNQAGLIENLNADGFDVVILQIFPPNASVFGNAVVIEDAINVLNQRAAANGSNEEIIVQGYSAGSLGARLALQMMEKKHLEQNGSHPHCRLYVSTDGEHLGANMPLGVQKAVEYLYNYGDLNYVDPVLFLKAYTLRYILNAPLSKQLLAFWGGTMDDYGNVGCATERTQYLNYQFSQDHSLTDICRSGFPTFGRNISISNGLHTPSYDFNNNYYADHVPFQPETGKLIYEDDNGLLRSKIRLSSHGFHEVFLFRKRIWNHWEIMMRGVTNNHLVLDNGAGGMMFIKENPVNVALELMDNETFGEAGTLIYTNFCFTPTVFTHNHNYPKV